MISATNDAYAAGFVEADGCIYLGTAACCVRVTNRNPKVLDWFMQTYGGVTRPKVIPAGCYEWVIYGDHAVEFLEFIRPYMKFKESQIDIALEFHALKGVRGRKIADDVLAKRAELLQRLKDDKAQWRS